MNAARVFQRIFVRVHEIDGETQPWRLLALLPPDLAVFADVLEERFGSSIVPMGPWANERALQWGNGIARLYRLRSDRSPRFRVCDLFFDVDRAPPLEQLLSMIGALP